MKKEINYTSYSKDIQKKVEEIKKLSDEIEKNKKEIIRAKEKAEEEINKYKNDLIKKARENKEENFKLFQSGIKKCLRCGYQSDERKVRKGSFNLFSPCKNCKTKHWLVGDNYPCEICNKIVLNPVVHHINGDRENNEYENLMFICEKCHKRIHLYSKNEGRKRKYNRSKKPEDPEIEYKIRMLREKSKKRKI